MGQVADLYLDYLEDMGEGYSSGKRLVHSSKYKDPTTYVNGVRKWIEYNRHYSNRTGLPVKKDTSGGDWVDHIINKYGKEELLLEGKGINEICAVIQQDFKKFIVWFNTTFPKKK